MGGPVHQADESLPSAEDHGFKKIDEEDYDPEAARKLWLETRERERKAALEAGNGGESGNNGGHASPTARVINPSAPAGGGADSERAGSGAGQEVETTVHRHVDPAPVQIPVQQPVERQVSTAPAARAASEAVPHVDAAPAQPQHAPAKTQEVTHGIKQEAAQAQSAQVSVQRPTSGGEERGHVQQPVSPVSPAQQPAADAAPAAAADDSATDKTRRIASLLESPVPRGERSELMKLDDDDPVGMLSGMALVGGLRNLAQSSKSFNAFFRTLERNQDGHPVFRSPQEEDIYNRILQIMQIASPSMQNGNQAQSEAALREDIQWRQELDTGTDEKFVIKNHPKQAHGLMKSIYRRQNSGAPVTVFLPASGFFITSKAPHENDFCDYDVAQTMDTNQVGLSTFGILLSASSGLYLKHMVNFALKFVVDTTLDIGDGDMHQTLYTKIDERDYWLVVMACTIAKYPGGIPWLMSCTEPQCTFEEEQKLNIARCIRYANGILSPTQLAIINRQREGEPLTFDQQNEYRRQHVVDPSSKWEDNDLTFRFAHASIARYIDTSEEWVADINQSTTDALGNYATEQERNSYMRTAAETRRLTRYLHFIESITAKAEGDDEPYVERDPIKIREALVALSSDRAFVSRFEAAIEKFNERSRLAIFGYMSHRCPQCGAQTGEKDGAFRGIVEISPDRLFFVLSRVVYEIQKLLTDQYENIG